MDAQPFDYGSLLRQGQAIVPDFAAEMAKKQLMALQQAQVGLQVAQAQQEQHEAQAFDEDLDGVLANPNADAYAMTSPLPA
jgi:nitric oxide reductase large subunit